jgi:hypothetical protein
MYKPIICNSKIDTLHLLLLSKPQKLTKPLIQYRSSSKINKAFTAQL